MRIITLSVAVLEKVPQHALLIVGGGGMGAMNGKDMGEK